MPAKTSRRPPNRAALSHRRRMLRYVGWGASPTFSLSLPDPATGKARRVFFPGCSLPGHSPHLVKAAYAYLREKLPDTGIMLNCCGAPAYLVGETAIFHRVLEGVARELAGLGAEELIAACPYCLATFLEQRPEIKVRSLFEVMPELGLPPGAPQGQAGVFNLHDPCRAHRLAGVHQAVRRLVAGLGHHVEELPHSRDRSICCGAGSRVAAVDPALTWKLTDLCLAEAKGDLITYCAACRARFAAAGRPALHIMDLAFNPRWQQAKTAPPPASRRRWWHRWRLKRHFQGL